VLAFRDIAPVAPTHVLLIPKLRSGLTRLQHATPENKFILGHMLAVGVPRIVEAESLSSYRLGRGVGAALLGRVHAGEHGTIHGLPM
jgi:histidine triad (HIT) family protein